VYSAKPRGWRQAIELGAEFVHGGDGRIRKFLGKAGTRLRAVDVPMWEARNGIITESGDFWDRIGAVAGKIPRFDHGWSFDRFLREKRSRISPEDRALARNYVEGFNAADPGRLSAHVLRHERAGADTEDFKPQRRYDTLIDSLRRRLPRRNVDVRLRTVVHRVEWSQGKVAVTVTSGAKSRHVLRARAVVCTLPLGVLKAGSVTFSPRLAEKEKLVKRAGWGVAVRIVIRFRRGFWESPVMPAVLGASRGRRFGFVNAPDVAIPVWWALHPPEPILTGWVGGRKAEKISESPRGLIAEATAALAQIFHVPVREVTKWVADWATHDWRRDPYSQGAYSFPVAGGEDIPRRLSEPVRGTLFFAGEAYADDYGTVHGALASGIHAAHQVGRALGAEYIAGSTGLLPLPLEF
jgi:monoamine oxidase